MMKYIDREEKDLATWDRRSKSEACLTNFRHFQQITLTVDDLVFAIAKSIRNKQAGLSVCLTVCLACEHSEKRL